MPWVGFAGERARYHSSTGQFDKWSTDDRTTAFPAALRISPRRQHKLPGQGMARPLPASGPASPGPGSNSDYRPREAPARPAHQAQQPYNGTGQRSRPRKLCSPTTAATHFRGGLRVGQRPILRLRPRQERFSQLPLRRHRPTTFAVAAKQAAAAAGHPGGPGASTAAGIISTVAGGVGGPAKATRVSLSPYGGLCAGSLARRCG